MSAANICDRSSYEMAKAYFKRTLREEQALNANKL
jgi:hypothetical protein